MKGKHQAFILNNIHLGPDLYAMEFMAPELAAQAQPGQFIMLSLSEESDPFLRRPFGLASIDGHHGRIRIIYQVVGKGTRTMSRWRVGQKVSLLGPLGQGFSWEEGPGDVILAGGGLGLAPLLPLAQSLKQGGKTLHLYYGCRTKDQLFGMTELEAMEARIILATEDGSCGRQGYLTQDLQEGLAQFPEAPLYACGPSPFLKVVQQLAGSRFCQLSLEERMACGLGACMGCAVEIQDGSGNTKMKRVCADGPVFNAQEVIFHG